ncbi:type II toxin-antitoxin system prevent-host-death family antitoxin [Craurococcus roseus]|uniref:Antitoxin n=1 Tax=Craurococcus roseus TaxID=77585 RepID=A0ABN1ELI2_9PROT
MEVGVHEAKSRLIALLKRVEQGEEIVITRHGRVVARLVPISNTAPQKARRAAMARIRARAAARRAGSFDWSEWKALRDEGRP